MNKSKIIGLCVMAFFAGDAEAIFRSNRRITKLNEEITRQNRKMERLTLEADLYRWVIENTGRLPLEEIQAHVNEQIEFIKLTFQAY